MTNAKQLAGMLLLLVAAWLPSGATTGYHLTATHPLPGDGFWDYLTYDPATKHLFVSHSTSVLAVDPLTGALAGTIPDTPGVHGVAVADDLDKGFTSNGRDGTVTVFRLSTLQTITVIRTQAKNPDGITYDPATHRVFTFNGGGNDATVIDGDTNSVVATIPLGGRPEFPAVDGTGMVYDNIESTSEIVAIDARTATMVKRFNLGTCKSPSGLSMDAAHQRLFAACDGEMGIVNARTGALVATVPTGEGTDATRYDANTGTAFASNGRSATLTVVHEDDPDHYRLVENAPTAQGARTMALDAASGNVYLVTAKLVPNPQATGYRDRYRMVPGTFEMLTMSP